MNISLDAHIVYNNIIDSNLSKNNIDMVMYRNDIDVSLVNNLCDLKLYGKDMWDMELYIPKNISPITYSFSKKETKSLCNIYSRASLSEIDEFIEDIDCFFDDFI